MRYNLGDQHREEVTNLERNPDAPEQDQPAEGGNGDDQPSQG